MSNYRECLNIEKDTYSLPPGLLTHIASDKQEDVSIEYSYPAILDEPALRPIKAVYESKLSGLRLPARINHPLIPYPMIVRQYISSRDERLTETIHAHHHSHLRVLSDTIRKVFPDPEWKSDQLTFDINDLKALSKQQFSKRTDVINLAALSYAKRATQHDLNLTAIEDINFQPTQNMLSPYMSFLTMIHRLRVHIAMQTKEKSVKFNQSRLDNEEASFNYYSNGSYSYVAKCDSYQYAIVSCGGHFRFFHSNLNQWFCGASTYLDYAFTVADILNNIDVIRCSDEYSWAEPFLTLITKTASLKCSHNDLVNFMKNLEGFLLNLSDYNEQFAMTWQPLMEAAWELWKLDQSISGFNYDFGTIAAMLHGNFGHYIETSLFHKIIKIMKLLNRRQIQELSSLHKFIFYAEVDSIAGVKKFLKRVHTPRKVDPNAVRNLTRLAKQLFLISYKSKHSMPPNMRGNHDKIKMLEVYCNQNATQKIKQLPLTWWDDVTLFNCMDNTLTADALEFAKDKGALRSEIHLGPGDSRKELLQVIEQKDYVLKDFFSDAPFAVKKQKIIQTNHRRQKYPTKHAARLIEKEREQKVEARLFANGELSDKHALSLVTTRMKKALSYFDEQLMTPSDKRRKEVIHSAAQLLVEDHNYSLLLDIEGHNQSMQATNTSELFEFLGHLFGFENWGCLPDYFSSLDVFHYNEYTDEAIVSNGQLGGIEGWINPGWTLHTTLMMKLLRHMTDIEIPEIMVYSDDVNAIIEIRQATEASVQATFNKIIKHCFKFGMIVKFSQTNLSKHRVTILRQHYADGIRADSTLKKLISTSGANNPMLMSEELEVSGICSSIASALELSNHSITCCYLKNYKIGLLLVRLPHMILSKISQDSILSSEYLPKKLNNILYYLKDDKSELLGLDFPGTLDAVKNDMAKYLNLKPINLNGKLLSELMRDMYGTSKSVERLLDGPDRLLYLQIYDNFLQDLLFFWSYLPAAVGGLGGIFHLNLVLSGHSSGFSKSIHYLHQWIQHYAVEKEFFYKYLEMSLSIDLSKEINLKEERALLSNWPNDMTICTANTSITQSIKHMVKSKTMNKDVLKLLKLSDEHEQLQVDILNLFRDDFHPRVAQFYYENTAVHFIDLLINKIETSSGLLVFVKNLVKLRNNLAFRTIENLRSGSKHCRNSYGAINNDTDTVEYLMFRKKLMFPFISFIDAEEVLYDNKLQETVESSYMLTVMKCSPRHYKDGKQVYDTPHMGNEITYKGEFLDDDRMLGNKEEFLAAKLVAVTKWFLVKKGLLKYPKEIIELYNCVKACNVALSTLTGQNFIELQAHTPTEIGGEILHRIPNIRFSTSTYIRSEMNLSLSFNSELNQSIITTRGLIDSNINFDYLRMRMLVASMMREKNSKTRRLITRYTLTNTIGIKDVQFMEPKVVYYEAKHKYTAYGLSQGHEFSTLRFRYMSASYLNSESVKDISIIPNFDPSSTIMQVGAEFLQDLVYRYARGLDRDYMRITPEYIDIRIWKPLVVKIISIDSKFKDFDTDQWINYFRDCLTYVMNSRKRITTVAKTDSVKLTLQTQCFESLKLYKPDDREYSELTKRFLSLIAMDRGHINIKGRLNSYQKFLHSYNEHKRSLGVTLIIEYIIYFHFNTVTNHSSIQFDSESSFAQLELEGMSNMSIILLCPEIQVQIMILGHEFVEGLIRYEADKIKSILREISEDNILADLIMPGKLPSLSPVTELTGFEPMPNVISEIVYEKEAIPYSAMATLSQITPLADFAHKCSTTGADPHAFTSITGSDSLGAQVGLYRLMMDSFNIDNTYRICDLTGGRGDFVFASEYLKLNSTTYSRSDQFTMIHHHPKVNFDKDYDLKKSETVKFIEEFDIIHIDVSFTGSDRLELLDLILYMESNNKAYTIRLNSSTLNGYEGDALVNLPKYDHFLTYPTNSVMKPYQIYLIGIPGSSSNLVEGAPLKSTIAFRSMALSYASLLRPSNQNLKLIEYHPNSLSVYFPKGKELDDVISKIAMKSILRESVYYANRYVSEIGGQHILYWIPECLNERDEMIIESLIKNRLTTRAAVYEYATLSSIGNVSSKSSRYHENHLILMKGEGNVKFGVVLESAEPGFLDYMRTHHPIQEERSKCNVILGCQKFFADDLTEGYDAVLALIRRFESQIMLRETLNQKEIQTAIKLLILAASRDNYNYGIQYCHDKLSMSDGKLHSAIRVTRAYRLLSCYYEDCYRLIQKGEISHGCIVAIENELEIREKQKMKYKLKKQLTLGDYMEKAKSAEILDQTFSDLFDSIEKWSQSIVKNLSIDEHPTTLDEELGTLDLTFDFGLKRQLDDAIIKLKLDLPNEHGIIDLGDDYDEYDPDWDEN